MTNPQPDESVASSAVSVDGLEKIFSAGPFTNESTNPIDRIQMPESVETIGLHNGPIHMQMTSALITNHNPEVSHNAEGGLAASDQKLIPQELIQVSDKVSRTDLVSILESFVKIIRTSDNPVQIQDSRTAAHAVDRTKEIDEMKRLLLEAQDTIIKLLTDRVEDRAKMATLESEVRLLPDLQSQANRAMAVAMNTEDFRDEVTKVKYELECMKLAKLRAEIEKSRTSWWDNLRSWLAKRSDRNSL